VIAARVVAFLAGAYVVLATFASSVRTVILPRGVPARLGRMVFRVVRKLFELRIGRGADYARRDRILVLYAPVSLLILLFTWLVLIFAGYAAIYWARHPHLIRAAFDLSGSSLFTLGFQRPASAPDTALALSEAILGLAELAMLIGYLPTIYGAFSRREREVAMLEVRAGSPPSGVEMLERFFILGRLERLTDEVWVRWEAWFVDIEESHTSNPALNFFRSPQPDHHWVIAAGAVLDAASVMASSVDVERQVQAEICIRAGYLALRRICDFFRLPYESDPRPDDPISIMRSEYDEVVERLAAAGVPMKPDRDQAWRDFAGWRVNYDVVLLALATLTSAPFAPWSSDRAFTSSRPRRRNRSAVPRPAAQSPVR
jgi:hypothetical protein